MKNNLPWKKTETRLAPAERPTLPMDELIRHFFGEDFGGVMTRRSDFIPSFEVTESADKLSIAAELPGMAEKDVELTIDDGILRVKGEKRNERTEEEKGYHISERSYGSFERAFVLPDGLDLDQVAAEFKDGVLTVTLPKDETKRETVRKIDIKRS